jgi:hypothetical protein
MADNLQQKLLELSQRADIPQDARDVIAQMITRSPLGNDVWIYRAVVVILGTAVIATVFGGLAIVLFLHLDANAKLPDAIVAIGSAAVGALAGLLAPSPAAPK